MMQVLKEDPKSSTKPNLKHKAPWQGIKLEILLKTFRMQWWDVLSNEPVAKLESKSDIESDIDE